MPDYEVEVACVITRTGRFVFTTDSTEDVEEQALKQLKSANITWDPSPTTSFPEVLSVVGCTGSKVHTTPAVIPLEWHRADGWTPDMLPEGYRPLVKGEYVQFGDETPGIEPGTWQKVNASIGKLAGNYLWFRTRRPLPEVQQS